MNNKLFWLDQINPADRQQGGDRLFYLAHLSRQGYPVLPGFAISPQLLWEVWQSQDWRDPIFAELPNSSLHVNCEDDLQLHAIAQTIRQQILQTELPALLIVPIEREAQQLPGTALAIVPSLAIPKRLGRSTRLHLSQLLEPCIVPKQVQALALALKHIWSQLFFARNILCWQHYKIPIAQLHLAVCIQPIGHSIASGRVQADSTRFTIQAVSGPAIELETAQPDCYHIDPKSGQVLAQNLGEKVCTYKLSEETGDRLHWQPELLAEEAQHQFALPSAYLQPLIQLAQNMRAELGSHFQFEWTLAHMGNGTQPELYITEAYPLDRPKQKSPVAARPKTSTELSGLAASGGRAIAAAWVLSSSMETGDRSMPSPSILVVPALALTDLPLLRQSAGLITEQGGLISHGAILARELGIPAVVGVANATQCVQTGQSIEIDGDRGLVNLAPSQPASVRRKPETAIIPTFPHPISTQLWVNLSQPSQVDRVAQFPVNGVGLIRADLMAIEALNARSPQAWLEGDRSVDFIDRMASAIAQFARAFAPRPVFYRAFDVVSAEANPSPLGVRGTYGIRLHPTLFDWELAALAKVRQSYANVHLILPFVRTVEEFRFCQARVRQVGLKDHRAMQLWMMAEVPSVLFFLTDYIRAGVQGIAIGSNDLTQLLLGADRDCPQMAQGVDPLHPAAIAAMQQLVTTAIEQGIPCSICGDAPARYPALVEALVQWGITAISVPMDAIEPTYQAIVRAEKRLLLDAARRSGTDRLH